MASAVTSPPARTGRALRYTAGFAMTAATTLLLAAKLAWFHAHLRDPLFDIVPPAGWHDLTAGLLAATFGSLLLAAAPLHLLPRWARYLSLVLLNAGVTLLAFGDNMHSRFYGSFLSATDISFAGFFGIAWPSIRARTTAADLWMFADAALCLLAFPLYLWLCRRIPREPFRSKWRAAAALACAGLVLLGPPLIGAAGSLREAYRESPRKDVAAVIGLLPYHAFDLCYWLASPDRTGEDSLTEARRLIASRREFQRRSPLFAAAAGSNVILINAESLNSFAIGLSIDGQPVTPHLTALIRESLYFPNFYDQTYLGTTSDAEFVALNSLYPSRYSATSVLFTRNRLRALPAVLAERGYATVCAVAADPKFWNMWRMHRNYGFTHRLYDGNFDLKELYGEWLSDRSFFTQMTPRLSAERQPFFAFLLTASGHHPFTLVPKEQRTLRLGALEGTVIGNYLQSVHYVDAAVGAFLDQLRAAGLLDHTIFAIYGDHTAFLSGEPELLPLLSGAGDEGYRRTLARKRIPFIIRLPEGRHAGVFDAPGGHLDIAPTLESLLGVADSHSVMFGQDLTAGGDRLVVFRDGGFTDGRHILLNRFGPISGCTCYDMHTGRRSDCAGLEAERAAAAAALRASDGIMEHDRIPQLSAPGSQQ